MRPATVLRWHRAAWRLWWRLRSGRRVGRPPIDAELRALIRRMWRENRLWGENRIAGELAKLGWRVSPRTVAKYRPRHLRAWPRAALEDLSPEPRLAGLGLRLLHGGHRALPDALRVRRHLSRAPPDCPRRCHRAPDGRVGGAAHDRGRRRRATALSPARPRQHLRRALPCSAPRPRGAMSSLAAQSAAGERDLRA